MISYVKIFTENKEGMSSFWGSYNDLKKKYHVRHSQLFIKHKQQGWWLIEQQDDLCLCHLNFCIDHIPDHLPRKQINIAQQRWQLRRWYSAANVPSTALLENTCNFRSLHAVLTDT